jgi:hypothetical protein
MVSRRDKIEVAVCLAMAVFAILAVAWLAMSQH